jgi:hypothetical protein
VAAHVHVLQVAAHRTDLALIDAELAQDAAQAALRSVAGLRSRVLRLIRVELTGWIDVIYHSSPPFHSYHHCD